MVSPIPLTGYPRPVDTRSRILDVAVENFGTRGYEASSLDAVAAEVDVSKQTILYHFRSKEGLLEATIESAAFELTEAIEKRIANTTGWPAIEEVVRAVFRVAIRKPALLGLLREVMRLGPPWATMASTEFEPVVSRARTFLQREMAAGRMRDTDPNLLMVSAYSTVMGVATEVEVLRAVGIEPTLRETVRRRRELMRFLRLALAVD